MNWRSSPSLCLLLQEEQNKAETQSRRHECHESKKPLTTRTHPAGYNGSCWEPERFPCCRFLSQLQLHHPPGGGCDQDGGSGPGAGGVCRVRGARQHPGHPVGVVPPPLALGGPLLHRQPGGGRPAAQLRRPALLRHLGGPRQMGVRTLLLRRLGRPGRALLHCLHPQPVRDLHRPVPGRQLPSPLPCYSYREAGTDGGGGPLGTLCSHIRGPPVRLEGAGPRGRHGVPDHRGARLRLVLSIGVFLHPSGHHPGHVLPGVHGGEEGDEHHQEGQSRRRGGDGGGGAEDPQRERRAGGEAGGGRGDQEA